MFDFLRRSGAQSPSNRSHQALETSELPARTDRTTSDLEESWGPSTGRTGTFFHVFDKVHVRTGWADVFDKHVFSGPPLHALPVPARLTRFPLSSMYPAVFTAMALTVGLVGPTHAQTPTASPTPNTGTPNTAPGNTGETAGLTTNDAVRTAGMSPLRTWEFAEGNSRRDFQTFFSILNLTDAPASVTASYQRDDNIRLTQWLGVPPRGRISLRANEVVGAQAFGASFSSDQDVVVERSTTWGPNQNGETTVGFAPNGRRRWHFAEGTTRGLVTTYFVTRNLTDAQATIKANFTRDDGSREQRWFQLEPRAREAFRMNELLQDTSFSASFESDQDIVVERTIMSEGQVGVMGGLGYSPSTAETGSMVWSFAEGSTRTPYLTAFLLFNPGAEAVEASLRFAMDGGNVKEHKFWLAPQSRTEFEPMNVLPAGVDFATSITTNRPIVVERSYYSTGDGLYGALGFADTRQGRGSTDWYFADGNTTGKIETFFLLYNLTGDAAQVRVNYFGDRGPSGEQGLTVPPGGRISVRANDSVPGRTFAARFSSDKDLVVERTFYFPGWSGFTTVGSGTASR